MTHEGVNQRLLRGLEPEESSDPRLLFREERGSGIIEYGVELLHNDPSCEPFSQCMGKVVLVFSNRITKEETKNIRPVCNRCHKKVLLNLTQLRISLGILNT